MKDWESLDADVVKIVPANRYAAGRNGHKVEYVVIHYNAGNLTTEGCYNVWLTRVASAHYQVESSGRIGQLVWDRDTAWHCGNKAVDPNSNSKSIGVEHANLADGTVTEACLDNGAHLVAALCRRFGLGRPEWMVNVYPHNHFAATSCPGQLAGSQRDEYMARAQYWYDVMTGAGRPEQKEPEAPLPEVLRRFVDLDQNAWYVGAVDECVLEGFMGGYDREHFGPNDALTRAQAVCVIANAARADLSDYLEPFEDVNPQPYYYAAVCWAVDEGVVSDAPSMFRPDDACTRAEFAAMLFNWMGKPDATTDTDLSDVPEWARGAVAWAVSKGVMGNGGEIRASAPCTRAECAAMLANLLD